VKQLVVASTFYQCLSLAAAVDSRSLPPADGERILLLANSSQVPELSVRLQDQVGFTQVAKRFDRVIDFAEMVYPRRPQQFAPRGEELTTWHHLLRQAWGLGTEPVQLLMDSVHVNPSLALAHIFFDATLYAHSDGLMVYSPTRTGLHFRLEQRLAGLIYLDLVPGLRPQLLSEHGVEQIAVPRSGLVDLLAEITAEGSDAAAPVSTGHPPALILGQYLSSLDLLTRREELELHRSMMAEAAARGFDRCVFKPHPSAPPTQISALRQAADELGVTLEVDHDPAIAEICMLRLRPGLVLSCFSTGLATARYLLGIEAVAVGSSLLLTQLAPYENSNRVPLVLADALFAEHFDAPGDETDATPGTRRLQSLVDTVAYCMQPDRMSRHRAAAVCYLEAVVSTDALPLTYFKRLRLTRLELPGRLPERTEATAVARRSRRVPRVVHRTARAISSRVRARSQASGIRR